MPGVPAYREQGFVWRNRFIPALDLQSLVSRRRVSALVESEQLAAIVAYENSVGKIGLGAILLRGIPKLVDIAPQQSVAVSQLQAEWKLFTQAASHVIPETLAGTDTESEVAVTTLKKDKQGISPFSICVCYLIKRPQIYWRCINNA